MGAIVGDMLTGARVGGMDIGALDTGAIVGARVVGAKDGRALGAKLGMLVCIALGNDDEAKVGTSVGSQLGDDDAIMLGAKEGMLVTTAGFFPMDWNHPITLSCTSFAVSPARI